MHKPTTLVDRKNRQRNANAKRAECFRRATVPTSEVVFKIKIILLGYFDPVNLFLIIKINDFWVNLSDISARTETLVPRVPTVFAIALTILDACECIKS